MPVNPSSPRTVLIVHGVQSNDTNLNQDVLVDELIKTRIDNVPLSYACDLYRYENVNVEALRKYEGLLGLLADGPVGEAVGGPVLEMIGDVVISLENGAPAEEIREGLRQKILDIFAAGNPCYIVAHSLGTIYTFDVLNALIGDGSYFDRGSRKTWPVQGLLTIGSPIGLDMFKVRGRDAIKNFGPGDKWFRWLNIWDPNDPVVSGSISARTRSPKSSSPVTPIRGGWSGTLPPTQAKAGSWPIRHTGTARSSAINSSTC
jgi:hypothetical protein